MTLSVSALTDTSVDLWGYDCDDLQDSIVVGDDSISGTLKYIEDYSAAGFDPIDGNFIALKCESNVEDAIITVTVTNPSVLDSDGIIVLQIADKDTQTITVKVEKEGYVPVTKVYTITDLVCQSE